MKQILVVIVSYFTEQEVYEQVTPFKDADVGFLIVDNGSSGRDRLQELDSFSNVSVVAPSHNLGYLNGGFFGLKAALATGAAPDWVILSNPDIVFAGSFFEKLCRINDRHVAMLAPSIISGRTGKDQNPYMTARPDRKHLQRRIQIHERPLAANLYRLAREIARGLSVSKPKPDTACGDIIYAAHGACMILAFSFLNHFPRWNYPPFLFCEELFLAEQSRLQSLPVIYRPDLALCHKEHRTTRVFRNRQLLQYHKEALAYCLNTYYSNE
ncbi:MAG: hypothetical protein ACQERN_06100 [Thermodesulfobacteriota bacterium]